ncbi:phosphopantetheine-binding protein [Streptomyces sp. NPDC058326]|uniref:phosphopantetheine-binding protein n=1 Tax=Streptomyces sp. NPDC058326 TaxID=3346447 RepID=UPI0036E5D603
MPRSHSRAARSRFLAGRRSFRPRPRPAPRALSALTSPPALPLTAGPAPPLVRFTFPLKGRSAVEEIKARLRRLLVDSLELSVEPSDVPDHGLVQALGLDSINTIEFLIWVESEFGVEIADEDLSIKMIDDLDLLGAYVKDRMDRTGTPTA